MKVGVLALQGDFAEHLSFLRRLGAEGVEVRLPSHLDDVDALIIPGGESTTPDLGHVRRRNFPLDQYLGTAASIRLDGYHGRTQRLRPPGR